MTDPKAVNRMREYLVKNELMYPIYADLFAEKLVEYFGTNPTKEQLLCWFNTESRSTANQQSVGIVAWDGDE